MWNVLHTACAHRLVSNIFVSPKYVTFKESGRNRFDLCKKNLAHLVIMGGGVKKVDCIGSFKHLAKINNRIYFNSLPMEL